MRRGNVFWLSIIAGVALSSCASEIGASTKSRASSVASHSTSPEDVQESFADSVTEVCVPMFPEIGDLKEIAQTSGIHLERLKAGSTFPGGIVTAMPVYRTDDGITHIRQNLIAGACEVFAYGAPVGATFDRVASVLTDDEMQYSEIVGTGVEIPEKTFLRVFEKNEADIVYTVSLSGNEPGAPGTMSRFSMLRATVSFKKAD